VLRSYPTDLSLDLVFVGYPSVCAREMMDLQAAIMCACVSIGEEEEEMHDLLIALAFVGMVIAPAIVAARVDNSPLDEGE
jgi:hypothetical protein